MILWITDLQIALQGTNVHSYQQYTRVPIVSTSTRVLFLKNFLFWQFDI